MFTEKMIAPCGLDCSLCAMAHDPVSPCPGCLGPSENKPDFCATRCGIINCERRKKGGYRFCDECPDFPCEHMMERENRYSKQYPLSESPIANIRMIREFGMEAFLAHQREQWTCGRCGGVISVQEGACTGCGTSYGS